MSMWVQVIVNTFIGLHLSNYIHMKRFNAFGKLIIVCLGAMTMSADAQEKRLSLSDALKLAEANYPSIKAAIYKKSGADFNVGAKKLEYMPALDLQEQVTYATANGLNGTYIPNGGFAFPTSGAIRPANNYAAVSGTYSTIAVDWAIFNFGKIKANVNLAKSQLNEADLGYQNELFGHKIKVADAYLLLLGYEREAGVQEKNLQRARELKIAITAASRSGLKAGTDSSFANAELSKAKIVLTEANGKVISQKIRLNELMGINGTSLEIDSMNYVSSIPAFASPDSVNINNNPQLKVFLAQEESQFAKSDAVLKSWLPSIKFLAAGMGRGSGISNTNDNQYSSSFGDGLSYDAYNYMLGVYFLWNVLDYPRVNRLYKSERMYAQESKSLYDEEKLKVQAELDRAQLQIDIARSQAAEAPVGLRSASDAYASSNARYKAGLTTLIDLTQNIYLLNSAESDLVIAYNNVWRAVLLKAAASGDLNLFLNSK
jgi:outer membrane protein TolC